MKKIKTQDEWIARAKEVLPAAGFGNFENNIIIKEGNGSKVWDEDGNEYIDYLIGSGPMLLGHGHPEVMEAILKQLPQGMTFFANNSKGIELAEEICNAVRCSEQVRYVSSGGEADMYAMRLARAFTGKDKILKFEGGYHGMSAEAQMSLSPSVSVNFPQAVPDSAGIPENIKKDVLIAPFNDLEFIASIVSEYHDQIAGIIIEPLQRIIPPLPGFLEGLRKICDSNNILLIFDEIVTGFRLAYGGAQEKYNVTPDICTLGKIIGGGFPLAAIAGSKEIMSHFDKSSVGKDKWLMQIGTLSGNPIASAAGLKTMEVLKRNGMFAKLHQRGQEIMNCMSECFERANIHHRIVGDPSLFDVLFINEDVNNYRSSMKADANLNVRFNQGLRKRKIFKASAKLYPSLALTDEDMYHTKEAIKDTVLNLV
jgi:glutamate-1-semialdehyde 2,1-aminomutase